MSNDHPFWAALGIRKGNPDRVIQHSQKCAPSAAADQTNAMARKFVEEGLGKWNSVKLYEIVYEMEWNEFWVYEMMYEMIYEMVWNVFLVC